MSELVQRLCDGQHPVVLRVWPESSVKGLKDALDRGYVHVKFTGTRGGTELGVQVDRERTDLANADLEGETGRITISGLLTLDYVDVRCTATVELPALEGSGCLELVDAGTAVITQ